MTIKPGALVIPRRVVLPGPVITATRHFWDDYPPDVKVFRVELSIFDVMTFMWEDEPLVVVLHPKFNLLWVRPKELCLLEDYEKVLRDVGDQYPPTLWSYL